MSERLTAERLNEIRECLDQGIYRSSDVLALLAELDAVRAERDEARKMTDWWEHEYFTVIDKPQ